MTSAVVFVMDDLAAIRPAKDTSFALMLEVQRRGLPVWYANEADLALEAGQCKARLRRVRLHDRDSDWFEVVEQTRRPLAVGDLILMRCDPPVDDGYVFATLMLERAQAAGARVVNSPQALLLFNEKLAIARFDDLAPASRVSARAEDLLAFIEQHQRAVLKPLDGMGGQGIFLTARDDPNRNVIIETLTDHGRRPAMVQQYLPEIADGDKRVLIVNGKPVEWMLARIPGSDDFRGNLARGGRGEGRPLGAAERRIAEHVGPVLLEHGIVFAGLDVIGDRLTEVNVTSPTCVRELDRQFDANIAGQLFDALLE
ncbi:MAG: glutathione synthase [Wenzhouxiangellaceae bacterium]|nr:glutathione synthase [Wenzhouxiangellaceae bacterium]